MAHRRGDVPQYTHRLITSWLIVISCVNIFNKSRFGQMPCQKFYLVESCAYTRSLCKILLDAMGCFWKNSREDISLEEVAEERVKNRHICHWILFWHSTFSLSYAQRSVHLSAKFGEYGLLSNLLLEGSGVFILNLGWKPFFSLGNIQV
jgi:hypothetical protein